MGKRGPKPTPPALKLIRGNPGKRPIAEGVKLPPAELVEPDWEHLVGPDDVAATLASIEWQRTVPQLVAHGVVSSVDAAIVEDYCVLRARLIQAERDVSRHGLTVTGAQGGVIRNPSLATAAACRTALRPLIGELGLGPSSRGGLKAGGGDADEGQRAVGILD